MFFNINQFPSLPFCGPHRKKYGVRGFSKHYHMLFNTKLCQGIYARLSIPCACADWTSMLDKTWIRGLTPQQKPRYQPVTYFTYWPVLGSFNNWNIIIFPHKETTSFCPWWHQWQYGLIGSIWEVWFHEHNRYINNGIILY